MTGAAGPRGRAGRFVAVGLVARLTDCEGGSGAVRIGGAAASTRYPVGLYVPPAAAVRGVLAAGRYVASYAARRAGSL
ncbi:MAG TPA: hypothetical protein VFN74_04130, partial [Chloroflexota bacterium]|nr:hypothetical protein [Chloroflexota bacterium]